MAQEIINVGTTANDGTGDTLRVSQQKANSNFTELYTNKVDKIAGKGLSENDFTDADKTKLDGIEAGAEVNVPLLWENITGVPDQLFASVGYFDHNDLATQTTPLTYTSGVELQLTNDTLGTLTDISQAPYGVSEIWDSTTNTFDLSALSIGDTIDLRVDLNLSTSTPASTVKVFLRIAEGTANEYDVFVGSEYYKNAATFEKVKMDLSYYIGNEDVRTTPAKLILISDDTAGSVKVNGWYNRIIRKSINVVSVVDADITFTDLTDTPSTYTGQAGKVATVNATEDALEFNSFIPLTGTEVSNPVSGDIEFEGDVYEKGFKQINPSENIINSVEFNIEEGIYNKCILYDNLVDLNEQKESRYVIGVSNVLMSFTDYINAYYSDVNVDSEGVSISATKSTSKGLYSTSYHGANYDDNTYVQKKYVDDAIAGSGSDIIEVANLAALPATGEASKIYITIDTNLQYRWTGSSYVQIGGGGGTSNLVWSYFSSNQLTVTGTASISIMDYIELPAEFLSVGFLEIQVFMRRTGSTSNSITNVYLGTNAVSLGELIAQKHTNGSGNFNRSLDRTIIFDGDTFISTSPTLSGADNNSYPARGDASTNYTVVRKTSFNIESNNFLQIANNTLDVNEITTLEGFTIKIYN